MKNVRGEACAVERYYHRRSLNIQCVMLLLDALYDLAVNNSLDDKTPSRQAQSKTLGDFDLSRKHIPHA